MPTQSSRRRLAYGAIALLVLGSVPLFLFLANGLLLGHGETPLTGTTSHPPALAATEGDPVVKFMAYNIAKAFAHKGGLQFESTELVTERLQRIAAVINAEKPDVVFLSETVLECGPCPINQVVFLAEATGMHAWAFGENYNFGVPFYRVVGGNAILSRRPLEPIANPSLAGRKSFYVTKNNRRALWCGHEVAGQRVLLASVHNDSYDLDNNHKQVRQLLDFAEGQAAVLAGDFNAWPGKASIELIRRTGRFTGPFEGPATFPADEPERRIDFIFAPATWELVDHHATGGDASDHLAVVSTFRIKP